MFKNLNYEQTAALAKEIRKDIMNERANKKRKQIKLISSKKK